MCQERVMKVFRRAFKKLEFQQLLEFAYTMMKEILLQKSE